MPARAYTTDQLKARLKSEQEIAGAHGYTLSPRTRETLAFAISILGELIERRERDELDATAHHLAYESCVSAFDSCLADVSEAVGVDGWRDLDDAAPNYDPEEQLDYLEKRGLIQRDAKHHNWIAVLDESEAAR